jgi:protein-S-isoprenylcysteine O-methyltransferase Ste14
MYLGIAIGLLGLAVVLRSWVNFVFPVLFAGIMNFVYIPHEERVLGERFGETYMAYRRRARRWI